MDFDQLEIFLEVARLSSFSRAAEKRFRTQPAISSQIRALEEEVGARLLDRSGGRVSLTVNDNRLQCVPIHRDELVVITPPKHPLAAKQSVTVSEVAAYPLVVPKAGHTRDALEALFYERHLKPHYAMELDSSELLK